MWCCPSASAESLVIVLTYYGDFQCAVAVCYYCSEDLESKYANKLTREMSGPEYEIISRIMKTLVNKKITVPGSFVR